MDFIAESKQLKKMRSRYQSKGRAAGAMRRAGVLGFTSLAGALLFVVTSLPGCKTSDSYEARDEAQRDAVTGLTPHESKEVLVKVGDREITLGDYAATLLRMDRFERLRYQTEERQKLLLDEMIEVELLAQEAKRLGLDKEPEVVLRMQQALRDEILRQLEVALPALESISEKEVVKYYKEHREEFKEPERRRILTIQLAQEKLASTVLEEAQGASGEKWGVLAKKYSQNRRNVGKDQAEELAGDLGFVSAPGEKRGTNDAVPDKVRAAIFEVKKVGDVVPRVVQDEDSYFIVKMGGLSPARDRSLTDATRTIRVELRRRMFIEAEKKLEKDLRKKYPVVMDEKAINNYKPPALEKKSTQP